ncbi:hypothetical protein IAT40_006666 [Kwoniella sp. CBS 6097]
MPANHNTLDRLKTKTETLLVTVGSTLFPSLTDIILSPPILEIIASSGISKLIVQYGRATLAPRSLKELGIIVDATGKGAGSLFGSGSENGKGGGEKRGVVLRIEVLRFTDDFEGLVRSSDYVISHAGSGSILTTLRTTNIKSQRPIPMMVVPNESLMDNHQAELADKMGKGMGQEGYLFVSRVEELVKTLPVFLDDTSPQRRSVKPFPQLNQTAFRDILDETMGYI